MPTWTTAFTAPPVTTGLVATPSPETSSVVLTWDVTPLVESLFWRYFIYRQTDAGVYERIGEVATAAPATFVDTEAPHGVAAQYLVTTSNGWSEGEADTAETLLSLNWWIVHPTNPGLTFEIRYVNGFTEAWAYEQESFAALGRKYPVVVSDTMLAPSGQLSVNIYPGDRPLFALLRQAALTDPYVILKSPFGDVYRVKLGDMARDVATLGMRPTTVTYRTVA